MSKQQIDFDLNQPGRICFISEYQQIQRAEMGAG